MREMLKSLCVVLVSCFFAAFIGLTGVDIFYKNEPVIDGVLIVLLAVGWFVYLVSNKLPPVYLRFLYLFVLFLVIHDVLSIRLLKWENMFYLLSLTSLLMAIMFLTLDMARMLVISSLFPKKEWHKRKHK